MKKIVLILFLCFCIVEKEDIFAAIPNWETIPPEGSYFENDNFAFIYMQGAMYYQTVNYVKIKSNHTYTIISKAYSNIISEAEVYYYDSNKNYIDLINYESSTYFLSFTTPSNASYLKVDVNLLGHAIELGKQVEEDLIMIEGAEVPLDYMNIKYEGVNQKYSEINTMNAYITKEVGESFNVENLKNKLLAFDDCDGDISQDVYIGYDYYTPNHDKAGLWEVSFRVSDKSDNETELHFFIYNKDNVPPQIVGPDKIQTNKRTLLSEGEILSNFTAFDEIDLDLTTNIIIKDSAYFDNYQKRGNWITFLEVEDSSGNKTTRYFLIEVIDDEPPVFAYDPAIINITLSDAPVTLENIIAKIKTDYYIEREMSVEVLVDYYSESSGKEGEYLLRLLVDKEIKDFKIVVKAEEREKQEKTIKKVLNSIKNFFLGIFNFFKNIWKKIF